MQKSETLKPGWLMMIEIVKWVQEHPEDKRDPAVIVRERSELWRNGDPEA